MSENTPQQPENEPHRQPGQPYGQQPPPPSDQPYGQPPPAGQQHRHQHYGHQPYAGQPGQHDPGLQNPTMYPGVEYPPDRTASVPGPGGENFFAAMFDYSFTRYITPTIVKVVYIVITVLVALGWLVALIGSFTQGWLPGILFLVFGWIIALIYLALARITLEFFVAVISVSEKVNRYAERDGLS